MIITTTKKLRPRAIADHYPTNSSVVRAAYNLLPVDFEPLHVLDHSAGTGVWGAVARERWPHIFLIGVEIQPCLPCPAYDSWYSGWCFLRFLAMHYRKAGRLPQFDLIIGNPPFKWAEAFVRLSLKCLRPGGWLIQYLRLAFLESQERGNGLWRDHMAQTVDVLSRRPSHTGNKKTDATAYAIFTWQQGNYPQRYSGGILRWDYGEKLPEDEKFRPMHLLVDKQQPPVTAWHQVRIEELLT